MGTLFRSAQAFCIGLSLADRGHIVMSNDKWLYVFCFADWEDADKLRTRYGGRWFKSAVEFREGLLRRS